MYVCVCVYVFINGPFVSGSTLRPAISASAT
jgi:hypothetical protein